LLQDLISGKKKLDEERELLKKKELELLTEKDLLTKRELGREKESELIKEKELLEKKESVLRKENEFLEKKEPGKEEMGAKLKEALLILHENDNNVYHKIATRRNSLQLLLTLCFIVVGAIDIIAFRFWAFRIFNGSPWNVVLVEIFGTLGAIFSVAYSLTNKKIADNIPRGSQIPSLLLCIP
jgi:hypothetical protein